MPKCQKCHYFNKMETQRFILEKYKGRNTRHTCPQCKKTKEFTRYIDQSGEIELPPHVGKCNRVSNCGYHYTPKQFFTDNPDFKPTSNIVTKNEIPTEPIKPASTFPFDTMQATLREYSRNNFFLFLSKLFGEHRAQQLADQFKLGTSKHFGNSTIFWQISTTGEVRAGKVMLYNPETGKRRKDINPTWVHSLLKLYDFNLRQCFFGEHLLSVEPGKPVAIVESEKTAIIMTGIQPQAIWLATGGANGARWNTADVVKALAGRRVILYPDLGFNKSTGKTFYELWSEKANEIRKVALSVSVSDLLERKADESDKAKGLDIADYFIKNIVLASEMPTGQRIQPKQGNTVETFTNAFTGRTFELEINADGLPAIWDDFIITQQKAA